MGFFDRAPKKTDITPEINQLRDLNKQLTKLIGELDLTSRVLSNKADLVSNRPDGDETDEND